MSSPVYIEIAKQTSLEIVTVTVTFVVPNVQFRLNRSKALALLTVLISCVFFAPNTLQMKYWLEMIHKTHWSGSSRRIQDCFQNTRVLVCNWLCITIRDYFFVHVKSTKYVQIYEITLLYFHWYSNTLLLWWDTSDKIYAYGTTVWTYLCGRV